MNIPKILPNIPDIVLGLYWDCLKTVKFLYLLYFSLVMGLFFGRDKVDEQFSELHGLVSDSFARVKQDSALLSQWIEYLYHLSIEQQRSMNDLRSHNTQLQSALIGLERNSRRQNDLVNDLKLQLRHMPSTKEEICHIVDSFYSFDPIIARLKHIEEKISEIEAKKAPFTPILPVLEASKSQYSLREKILRRITRNSKDFVKSSILSLMSKYGKVSGLQPREMIVDEQGLCSKSSFYRLLEEIEKTENVEMLVSGKEKIYLAKTSAHSLRSENTK